MVLIRGSATTDDIAGLAVCAGLVTNSGARTSHAAVVAGQLGVVTVVGCRGMSIDTRGERVRFGEHEVAEGELITVDGDRGLVFAGQLALTIERPTAEFHRARAAQTFATTRRETPPAASARLAYRARGPGPRTSREVRGVSVAMTGDLSGSPWPTRPPPLPSSDSVSAGYGPRSSRSG